jgi:hypothetical protein
LKTRSPKGYVSKASDDDDALVLDGLLTDSSFVLLGLGDGLTPLAWLELLGGEIEADAGKAPELLGALIVLTGIGVERPEHTEEAAEASINVTLPPLERR